MAPTWIGLIIIAIGLTLLFSGRVWDMFFLVLVCTLFGGSAALVVPILGSSTIPPAQCALVFMLARLMLPGSGRSEAVKAALRNNIFLGLYAAYGLAIAFIGPRLFAGHVDVAPLRFDNPKFLLQTTPLAPTPQNITASVYIVGTFLFGVAAHAASREPDAWRKIVNTAVLLAAVHVFFGVSGALLGSTPYADFIALIRNANYAQLNQEFGSLSRISGIFPETSSYSTYGFAWFVFLFECWYRNISPWRTGLAAAAVAMTLLFTTSSTAYFSIAGYAAIFTLRHLFAQQGVPYRKVVILICTLIFGLSAICIVMLTAPQFADEFSDMVELVTVGKQNSESGIQRAFFARTGLTAFIESYGIGIGPGSFRSSSFLAAMIGSVGLLGAAFFVAHFVSMLKPARASTYSTPPNPQEAVGAAAGWAALGVMIPLAVVAASADPGPEFAILAGIALGLRGGFKRQTSYRYNLVKSP